uniref:HAP1 N-terminal domain-containing protein n=1 Tax=Strongyloides stercoralis TaxID=6248 RepID=A0A0K0EJI8_STRER
MSKDMLSSLKDFITNLNEKNKKIDDTLKTTKVIEKKLHDLSQFNDNREEGESLKKYHANSEYKKVIDRLRLENATIRELKEERGDLRVLLQDYHNTLEVVMKKHRQIEDGVAVANEVLHDLDVYEDANRDKDKKMARLEYENQVLYGLLFNTFKRKKLLKKCLKKPLNGNFNSNDTVVDEASTHSELFNDSFVQNNDTTSEDETLNLSSQSGYDSDDSIQTVIYRNDESNK